MNDHRKTDRISLLIVVNRLQFLLALVLVSIIPMFTGNSYLDYGSYHTLHAVTQYYFFHSTRYLLETSVTSLSFTFIQLFFVLLALYFLLVRRSEHYFEIIPLTLVPMLLWGGILAIVSRPPSMEMIIQPGFYLLALSTIISAVTVAVLYKEKILETTLFTSFLDRNKPEKVSEQQEQANNTAFRLVLVFALLLLVPVGVSAPTDLTFERSLDGLVSLLLQPIGSADFYFANRGLLFVQTSGRTIFSSLLIQLLIEVIILNLAIYLLLDFKRGKMRRFEPQAKTTVWILLVILGVIFSGIIITGEIVSTNPVAVVFLHVPLMFIMFHVMFPWLLMLYAMINQKKNPELALDGFLLFFIFITVLTVTVLAGTWLPINLTGTHSSELYSNIRPALTILVIPVLARKLWQQGSATLENFARN